MIPILPDHIIRQRPTHPALKRLFLQIRNLPLDGARAWMSFALSDTHTAEAPDFLLIDQHGHCYLLSAGDLKNNEAEEYLQPGLFELRPETLSKIQSLQSLSQTLSTFPQKATLAPLDFFSNIPRLLICPDLSDKQCSQLSSTLQLSDNGHCFGLANRPLGDCLSSISPTPLIANEIDQLRALYLPECRVPAAFIPRLSSSKVRETNRSERFTDYLLDFDQESWVKSDLQIDALDSLHPNPATSETNNQKTLTKKNSGMCSRVITGVAGSGKSLTLLYRARLLANMEPQRRILFITHNKPLIGDLQWRYDEIQQTDIASNTAKVEFFHFFRWLGKHHHQDGLQLISESQRSQTISELSAEIFPSSPWPASFFSDEIGFIADQADDSESSYLTLDRTGRGLALDATQRHQMHELYRRYRMRLASNREADWHSLVRFWWGKASKGQIHLPRYDYIFVDEGQFFAPLWFSILKLCLNPDKGELIVAADPTQGFLKRRQSWKSVGLDVRGRTTKLHHCYRNTAELQRFTRRFFLQRQTDSSMHDEIQLPEENQSASPHRQNSYRSNSGVQMIRHPTPQDSLTWISNEVAHAIKKGLPPQAILVIHHSRQQLELLHQIIAQRIGSEQVSLLSHDETAHQAVALATLNSTTGIERPIVFLAGIDELFEQEGDPRLEHNERKNMIRDHTRKIYMALTRAGQKLLISYTSDLCRQFFDEDHLS
ncbi:MAG: 3'-5' exonuclease [Verrucomicrobiota bacterium]